VHHTSHHNKWRKQQSIWISSSHTTPHIINIRCTTARAKATMVRFIKSTMPIIVICLTISAELRLVTDGQTDGQSNSSPNFWATWLCLTYTAETEATMRRLFRDDSLSRFDRTPACCDRNGRISRQQRRWKNRKYDKSTTMVMQYRDWDSAWKHDVDGNYIIDFPPFHWLWWQAAYRSACDRTLDCLVASSNRIISVLTCYHTRCDIIGIITPIQ